MCAGVVPEEQLARQRSWLGDSWIWLLRTRVLAGRKEGLPRPTALDVGCGPGLVMELLSPFIDVEGIDIDHRMVSESTARGLRARVARAEELPFEDGAFDIVYCSFLLLWTADPVKVVKEMARVSRDWVICLAEPDHFGRISYPPEITAVDRLFIDSLRRQGADPQMGRKLQGTYARCGLRPDMGVHASMWNDRSVREGSDAEWNSLVPADEGGAEDALRNDWDAAAANGSLVQFNPVFYAMARKGR
ncbi:MAG: class I SAM-dependent methyltransferase [Methanomassiliicoccus sp.]|nr:class I SAM-dependent methyltransferase [Methanomassiliicoccus sp.]